MTQPTRSPIYLDANATTPVLPSAIKAAIDTMENLYGNPSSSHITGIQAKFLMEQTRQAASSYIGANNGKIIFTSGATEGIQTAVLSALIASKDCNTSKKPCLLYGATEHKAVPESLKHWNQVLGINADILPIPVDHKGNLNLDFIAEKATDALLICTMAVNNETGVYQDLSALELCIRSNNPRIFWMVDCVQAFGKLKLNLAQTSIDYAPFSGHKLYAPKGIGMLYIRNNAPFTPFIAGGGQESGLRSGTEIQAACQRIKTAAKTLQSSCLLGMDAHQDKRPISGLLQFKSAGACCWLYTDPDSRETLIIDPLPELKQRLINLVRCQELRVSAILDTHGHGDHQSCRESLQSELVLDGLTSQNPSDHLGWPVGTKSKLWRGTNVQIFPIGNKQLLRFASPGHTADSTSLIMINHKDNILFTFCGDTILPGSIGRSNFPTSSTKELYSSLKILYLMLGKDSLLLPAHDYHNDFFTNFKTEITKNTLLRELLDQHLSLDEFICRKTAIDANINDEQGETIMCGAYQSSDENSSIYGCAEDKLNELLTNHPNSMVLDVREPYEYELSHRGNSHINIPLTQLADFVAHRPQAQQKLLILICRSGVRSLIAAQALERFGFPSIAHVTGGYALAKVSTSTEASRAE